MRAKTKILLFATAVILGGLGGALGSIVGNAFGKTGLFAGGVIGGLLASVVTARVAASRRWITPSAWGRVATGTGIGFLVAAGITINSLSTPIGPLLSTLLVGVGALAGARVSASANALIRPP